ncbi:unnamed protein product [Paramecium sonneborni]|uniref:Uncharacterized protein n=1 Tax=Paramecium sonneborni TaxID=65129 RepID=A0A8S1M5J0_9CILI|nr:unnamed protein product [Paramecium sonneborni]
MAKCLWCFKELDIFGMLFHKAVCLEYLYSKSLDKLKQAKQAKTITKAQYLKEKRNLREYFMARFKPKVYEAFIKRQKEQQYIIVNPNDLSVGLESDIDIISKKACIESQEISQKSQFFQSFQNQIDPAYNYIRNNYQGNQDQQSMHLTNQFINDDDNNKYNNQIELNQLDDMSIYQNFGNINLQYENQFEQFLQLSFKEENHNLNQSEEKENSFFCCEKPQISTPLSYEEQKENALFKLLQKKVKTNIQKEFKQTFSKNSNKNETQTTRLKCKKTKGETNAFAIKVEKNKANKQQEDLATEIQQIGKNTTAKNNPSKFSKIFEKIKQKNDQLVEISSLKEPNIKQKKQKNIVSINSNTKQNNLNHEKEKSYSKEIIRTRYQASIEKHSYKAKSQNNQRGDKQKIKQK